MASASRRGCSGSRGGSSAAQAQRDGQAASGVMVVDGCIEGDDTTVFVGST